MAWVDRPRYIPLSATPSFIRNNLSCSGKMMAYAQGSLVFTVEEGKKPLALPMKGDDPVMQVAYCEIEGKQMLVAVTNKNVMAWDVAKNRAIFTAAIADLDKDFGEGDFFRGIACVPPNKVCVGYTKGTVFLFEENDGSLELEAKLKGHEAAVAAMGPPQKELLLSGDDEGRVMSWTGAALSKECCFEGRGSPVMSITGRADMVVAAYMSGHIRIFSRKAECLKAEVAAHSRPVSALAMHPSRDQFVSAGEDSLLYVWTLPDFESKSSSDVDVLFQTTAKDKILVGVGFYSGDIVANAYDTGSILIWKRNSK